MDYLSKSHGTLDPAHRAIKTLNFLFMPPLKVRLFSCRLLSSPTAAKSRLISGSTKCFSMPFNKQKNSKCSETVSLNVITFYDLYT